MVVAHGSLAGLSEFYEIVNMIVPQETLLFMLKELDAWYLEHYQAHDLVTSTAKELRLISLKQK